MACAHDTAIDTAAQDMEISGMIKFELLPWPRYRQEARGAEYEEIRILALDAE